MAPLPGSLSCVRSVTAKADPTLTRNRPAHLNTHVDVQNTHVDVKIGTPPRRPSSLATPKVACQATIVSSNVRYYAPVRALYGASCGLSRSMPASRRRGSRRRPMRRGLVLGDHAPGIPW